jgi:hypothetical protein
MDCFSLCHVDTRCCGGILVRIQYVVKKNFDTERHYLKNAWKVERFLFPKKSLPGGRGKRDKENASLRCHSSGVEMSKKLDSFPWPVIRELLSWSGGDPIDSTVFTRQDDMHLEP